ncbi:MAG TPA: protocatechuate 3,4-dioxygenase subunit alpha [Acetobacteraceae bacterium]|nr:protocatechuate 3,4-dioxygenase subunit alpha [Acetobacteraceae bacterium]
MNLPATASQTVGPFFRIGLEALYVSDLAPAAPAADKIAFQGRVLDGDGKPVNDAILEIWQANAHGKYAHPDDAQDKPVTPDFRGFGRVATDDNGVFRFITIKPGSVAGPHGMPQAPHLLVAVFMRGLLIHLLTRIYFPGETANADDPILALVHADRRQTLVARKTADGLEWDVILQGDHETVFFSY